MSKVNEVYVKDIYNENLIFFFYRFLLCFIIDFTYNTAILMDMALPKLTSNRDHRKISYSLYLFYIY